MSDVTRKTPATEHLELIVLEQNRSRAGSMIGSWIVDQTVDSRDLPWRLTKVDSPIPTLKVEQTTIDAVTYILAIGVLISAMKSIIRKEGQSHVQIALPPHQIHLVKRGPDRIPSRRVSRVE